jgi:ligand-binding sensor domain-containing protein/signal transduction histidine kinase
MLQFAGLWLCVFCGVISAMAGNAAQPDSPFIVDSWSSEEGLPDNEVISIIQTRDGYLWLGTLHGLVRFDGIHFTIFDENKTRGLPSSRIVYLFEDSRTNLWVGTDDGGLCAIQNGLLKNFIPGGPSGKIIGAFEDEKGTVWFGTTAGSFFCWQDGKLNLHPSHFPEEFFLRAFHTLTPEKNGVLWRLQNKSVEKFKGDKLEEKFGDLPWPSSSITGVYKIPNGNFIQIQFDENITAICEDGDGNLIVGTRGYGVFLSDSNGKWQQISTEQGLSSPYVLSLCMDDQGNLWAGTDGGGLDRIKRKIFSAASESHPLVAQSVAEDKSGAIWTAYAGGVSCLKSNVTQDFGSDQGLQDPNAWTVLVDHRQQVWVGTRFGGLFQFQTNQFIRAPGAETLGPQIFALFEDRAGQLWAGTQKGLANFDGQKWKLFTTNDGLSENTVRAIAQDADENFWVGTENGALNLFKDGKFSTIQKSADGLPGNDITCLCAGKNGGLWVGTYDHGLALFQNGKWLHFSTANGLASDSISYVIEDDGGDLWVGSNLGLMRIQKISLEDFADGKTDSIFCRTYGKTDGLPTRECSAGSQPAALLARDGRLFFPTTEGVISVNPADLKPNSQPPQVLIESVLVDGREQKTNRLDSAWSQSIVVPPGYEQLEIDYTALNFSAPDAVRFKCWLEGHETAPTEVGGERVARYPKLPPGNYRFHVTAENEDGVWNQTGSVLKITVQPYFWQTTGFRAAAIIFILAIVAAMVRYISTQKLRRELQLHKQQEALERERARIARDLHDQLGANLTQVALLGEMAEADKNSPDEIESHAKQISETARETTHSLDEIVWAINPFNDTLEGLANYACKYAQEYLALAGLRYRVDLPAQLPPTPIPPEVRHNVFLAFKEAVNNVVKHAQASEVWIRLRLQPENFILEIEDNGRGIGNQAAPQNRNGLRNMKKRMEDIRGKFSISGGAGGGTIVRLAVPLKQGLELE